MKVFNTWKGPLTVISGFILCLVISTQIGGFEISWGFIIPYYFSYHHIYNPDITANDIDLGLPMTFVGSIVGTILGPILNRKIGLHPALFISLIAQALGILFVHFTYNSFVSVCFYGVLVGYTGGSFLVLCTLPFWSYYPEKKGMMTGISFLAYTAGAGVWGTIAQFIINPANLPANRIPDSQDSTFPDQVIQNFQNATFYMIIAIAILGIPAALGVSVKQKSEEAEVAVRKYGLKDFFRNWGFWKLNIGFFVLPIYQQFICQSFKQVGIYYLNDDQLMAFLGTAGFATGALGRFIWPTLLDKWPYKQVISLLSGLMIIIGVILPFTFQYKIPFMVVMIIAFFVAPGYYPCGLVQAGMLFGNQGGEVFGYMHFDFAGGVFALSGLKYAMSSIGYWMGTYIVTGLCVSVLLMEQLTPKAKSEENLKEPLLP